MICDYMSEQAPKEKIITPTRRVFLKGMLGAAGLAVLGSWQAIDQQQTLDSTPADPASATESTYSQAQLTAVASEISPALESPAIAVTQTTGLLSHNPLTGPITRVDEHLRQETSWTDSVRDGAIATGAVIGYSVLSNNKLVGLYSGNSGGKELLEKYRQAKLKTAFKLVVAAPVIEEALFRALPAVHGDKKSLMPLRGIVSTYLFGKMHQLAKPAGATKPELAINHNMVPVQQYGLGAFLWMKARRRGVGNSMITHATINGIVTSVVEAASHSSKTSI